MKAYKIVSKEPIIENSLVKIVMAPHNVLEQLSQPDHDNVKYAIDTIDKSGGNVPINGYHRADDIYDPKLIQNGNGNVNVEDFSLEDDGNVGFMTTIQPEEHIVRLHNLNNIQVIRKSHKQQPNDRKIPLDVKSKKENAKENFVESKIVNEVEIESVEQIPEIDTGNIEVLTTAEPMSIDPTYTEAEELLSNPTTSHQNLIPTLIPEDIKSSEEIGVSTEINDESLQSSHEILGHSYMASLDVSTEQDAPLAVLKILKNRTVLVEETTTDPQSIIDQLGMATTSIPKTLPPPPVRPKKIPKPLLMTTNRTTVLVEETTTTDPQSTPDQPEIGTTPIPKTLPLRPVRPKKISKPSTTTTNATKTIEVKESQFHKKANQKPKKYKNSVPKINEMSSDTTTATSLSDVETTQGPPPPSDTLSKSKNIKRAIGDERPFSNNIVRPSPIKQKKFGELFPRETDAERADRLSKSMQRLMHFVTIVGQVDSYVTKRFRHGLKNAARILDSMEDTRRRRSHM